MVEHSKWKKISVWEDTIFLALNPKIGSSLTPWQRHTPFSPSDVAMSVPFRMSEGKGREERLIAQKLSTPDSHY